MMKVESMKKKKDALVETIERMDQQGPVLNEAGKFSLSKLAELIVRKTGLVNYKGLLWRKEGYNLIPTSVEDRNILALDELYALGLQDLWSTQEQRNIELFYPALCKTTVKEPPENWLFTANAVIDLETLKVIYPDPEYAVINPIPVEYDPKAKCPVILDGFKKAFSPEQQVAFLSIFGARLTGSTKLKSHVILSGSGNQSKGSWREVIAHIFGKRMSQDDIRFTKDKFRAKAFVGTCIIWNSETSGDKKMGDLVKEITGGTRLAIEAKGKDLYSECDYQAIFVEDTNSLSPPAMSPAMRTRLQWFPMSKHFVREAEYEQHKGDPKYVLMDPNFNKEYLKPKELSGFLNLLLPYAQYFALNNDYKEQANKDLEAFADVADAFRTFENNFISVRRGSKVHTRNLEKYFIAFCEKSGSEAKPGYSFIKFLTEMGGVKGEDSHYRYGLYFDKAAYQSFMSFGQMPEAAAQEE
jgi:phage/plasmid-associated DNA primase